MRDGDMEKALRSAYRLEHRRRMTAEMYLDLVAPERLAELKQESVELAEEMWEDCERPLLRERRTVTRVAKIAIPVALGLAGFVLFGDHLIGALVGFLPAARPLVAKLAPRCAPVARGAIAKAAPRVLAAMRPAARLIASKWHLALELPRVCGINRRAKESA